MRTERLTLRVPDDRDLDGLFAIQSDPRVWTHYPSLRVTDPADTLADIRRWRSQWRSAGLAPWVVRVTGSEEVVGNGGCSAAGEAWNLGYRLSVDVHGNGYATELARAAVGHARDHSPERPIVARMVEHNAASVRVAERLGFTLAYRGRDVGNPDPSVVRLIYADRTLTREQIVRITGWT